MCLTIGAAIFISCSLTINIAKADKCISGYKYDSCTGLPLPGWQILVIDVATNSVKGTATTSVAGIWQVCGLLPGNYRVTEILKPGWQSTNPTSSNEHIFVRGNDNQLWDRKGSWTVSGWSRTWNPLGGYLANGPIATIEPGYPNYVAVFAKGGDNALWMCDVNSANNPETGTWHGFGGTITSDPFAIADASAGKIHLLVGGGDSALWENIFSTTPWNPDGNQWQSIGGSILAYPPGAAIGSLTQAFVVGTDHALWRNVHTT